MSSHTRSLKRWIIILGVGVCMLVSLMLYLIWRDGQLRNGATTDNADATSIVIQRNGFDDIRLSRIEEQWQVDSPCRLSANEQRLSPLLSALTPGVHQYTANEVDLEAAGLRTPQAIVFVNEQEYRIGNTDLTGERRYVQRGDVVEFVPEWVLSLVKGGVTALAHLEIFPETLNSLTITDTNGRNQAVTLPDELAEWQGVTAQQISIWPLPEVDLTRLYTVQATDAKGLVQLYTVFGSDTVMAIRLDEAQCAYILSPDALPK